MRPLFLAFLALGLGVSGFLVLGHVGGSVSLEIVEISTNKEVYHSAELMNLTLFIQSDSYVEDVKVTLDGVHGKVSQEKTVDLKAGLNEVSFYHTLPKCNVCGGIKPGKYELVGALEYDNNRINKSTTIDIQQ